MNITGLGKSSATPAAEKDLYCVTTVLQLVTNVFRKKMLEMRVEEARAAGRPVAELSFKAQFLHLIGLKGFYEQEKPHLDMKYHLEDGKLIPMPKEKYRFDLKEKIGIDLQINWRWAARARGDDTKNDLEYLASPIHRFLQWYVIEKEPEDPFRMEVIKMIQLGVIPGTMLLLDNESYSNNIAGPYIGTLIEKMETAIVKGEAAFKCKKSSAFGDVVKQYLTLNIVQRINQILEHEFLTPGQAVSQIEEHIDVLQMQYQQAQMDMLKVTLVE